MWYGSIKENKMADIDFGQLSEALNDKSDRDLRNVDNTAGADAVIDYQLPTAENDYTWYRKYKSGWVEQGGIVTTTTTYFTVTFPVTMANTYYFTAVTRSSQSDATMMMSAAKEKTTTTMKVLCGSATGTGVAGDVAWQVSGIAA